MNKQDLIKKYFQYWYDDVMSEDTLKEMLKESNEAETYEFSEVLSEVLKTIESI